MIKKIFPLFFALAVSLPAWAQGDDWDAAAPAEAPESVAPDTVAPVVSDAPDSTVPGSSESAVPASSSSVAPAAPPAPITREVPVRYWVMGDSVELDAIFVKIENDTVYMKVPNEAEQIGRAHV